MRVDVVWFGEIPYHMDRIENSLAQRPHLRGHWDVCASVSSRRVCALARAVGAQCHEFNLQRTAASAAFDVHHFGKASQTLPQWVESP